VKRSASLSLLPLALSGCISFGAKPPPSLISLSSAAQIAEGAAQTISGADALSINVPLSPQAIATNRVAVSTAGTEIAYVKDALWSEPPARLFQRMLAETVTAKTGKVVLDPRQFALSTGPQLSGQLKSFGIQVAYSGAAAGEALVIYDAALSRERGQKVVTRRFEGKSPVGRIDSKSVGPALNLAANAVAVQVADWVAAN
jgi:cholesterol transport system auxiliary component